MPFKSQAQRNLMFAAKNDPKVRKRTGISKKTAEDLTEHDTGGKLPKKVKPPKRRR